MNCQSVDETPPNATNCTIINAPASKRDWRALTHTIPMHSYDATTMPRTQRQAYPGEPQRVCNVASFPFNVLQNPKSHSLITALSVLSDSKMFSG